MTEGYARFSFAFSVGGRCDMVCDHCSFTVEIEPFTLLVDLIDAADTHTCPDPPGEPHEQ